MEYCAESDPQARRCLFILKSFRDVVTQKPKTSDDNAPTIFSTPTSTFDPMESFLGYHGHQSHMKHSPTDVKMPNTLDVPGWSQSHSRSARPAPPLPAARNETTPSISSTLGEKPDPRMMLDSVSPPSNPLMPQPIDYRSGIASSTLSDVSGSLPDAELDFESFLSWQVPAVTTDTTVPAVSATAAPIPLSAPNLHLFRPSMVPEYAHFGPIPPDGASQGGGPTGLGGGVPLYPSTNYL